LNGLLIRCEIAKDYSIFVTPLSVVRYSIFVTPLSVVRSGKQHPLNRIWQMERLNTYTSLGIE